MLTAALLASLLAGGADAATTQVCLHRAVCREVNPVLAPLALAPALAVKGSQEVLVAVAGWQLVRHGHRKAGLAILLANAAVKATLAVHTARIR